MSTRRVDVTVLDDSSLDGDGYADCVMLWDLYPNPPGPGRGQVPSTRLRNKYEGRVETESTKSIGVDGIGMLGIFLGVPSPPAPGGLG